MPRAWPKRPDSKTGDARPRRSAEDKALALLARREQSRHELASRLQREAYSREEIDAALDALARAGYQSDVRFAEMLVRSRVRQGYGPARLRAELRTHGLPETLIEAALDESQTDWTGLATEQARRRIDPLAGLDYQARARHMQFLLRRGFDAGTARAAVHAVCDGSLDRE